MRTKHMTLFARGVITVLAAFGLAVSLVNLSGLTLGRVDELAGIVTALALAHLARNAPSKAE